MKKEVYMENSELNNLNMIMKKKKERKGYY